MKKLFTLLTALLLAVCTKALAQGWPQNYDGVMLQGFYWDSYDDTRWTTLEGQATELAASFNQIWVPQSGYCNTTHMQMGYLPIWWFNHLSAFGTEAELRQMIKTFKSKGTGIIEDVVINHRAGNTNWCDFPTETWNGKTMTWTLADICANDDGGNTKKNGYDVSGADDTGDDFGGGRDLDHTRKNVRDNIKAYLSFLLTDLGYDGFRYDMVKGYAAHYIGEYNTSANPTFSVGEYWDGNVQKVKEWIAGTRANGAIQSAAFDFPMKYVINDAFGQGRWNRLADATLAADEAYSRYAVTFVDNHDTGRPKANGGDQLYANVLAANAYILTMPGTPCVFLRHWKMYKQSLKRLIATRKAVGLTNQSKIIKAEASAKGFTLCTQGTKGKALLLLGEVNNAQTAGYQLAVEGPKYKLYVSNGVDLTAVKAIKGEDEGFKAPDFCQVKVGERCAFFEAPANWNSTITCWQWDNNYNYTGNQWPGVACTKVGTTANGTHVWKWTWDNAKHGSASGNEGIIFSNSGNPQTADLPFENGGYYTIDGLQGVVKPVTTGITSPLQSTASNKSIPVYTIDGKALGYTTDIDSALKTLPKGTYIIGKKKYVVK